ncbi:MAG: hypothetical protein CVU88_04215 [Firmicutes bacterium HGW-Firmicutes-13]|nr:MAG: hypothetical protein CVU88_04215 [Firmicutes bacterium HGW-Firmicutes-13]
MCKCNKELELLKEEIEQLRQKLNESAKQKNFKINESKTYELSTQLDNLIIQYIQQTKS